MVRTRARSPVEVNGAKEDPAVVPVAITITIAKTTQLKNIHLKNNEKRSDFQTSNYQNWA